MKTEKLTRAGLSRLFIAASLIAVTSLIACTNQETRSRIDKEAGEAQQQLTQARQPSPDARHYDPLVVSDKVWSGNTAFRMHRGLPIPARYETPRGITIVSGEPMPLAEIAAAITAQTGIPVRIMDAGVHNSSSAAANPLGSSLPGAMGASAAVSSSGDRNIPAGDMPVSYEGSLSGLMEKIAGYFNVDWRYDGTSINVVRLETRVFMIEALPQTATMQDSSQGSSSISSSGSGGGSGGGGSSGGSSGSSGGSGSSSGGSSVSSSGSLNQNIAYTGTIKYWEELKETLTAVLGGTGSVIVSPSSGEVTITTTPELMRTVASYLEQENKRISRQIAINVEVFSINLTEGEDFNVSFTALLNRLGKGANLSYSGPTSPTSVGSLTGLGSLSIAILNPNNSQYDHPVDSIIKAMSAIGDLSQVAQFPMVTLNNRPVSRFVGTSINYVPTIESNTINTTTTSTSETVTTATINSGFTIQLTPRLLDDGRIMMQYSLNIAGVPTFEYFNSCTGTTTPSTNSTCPSVQLPTQQSRSFIQQSVLHTGSTLMIGGVDEEDVSQNAQGVGNPFNFLLGGGTSNARTRTMVFIAITPQVLDDTMQHAQSQ